MPDISPEYLSFLVLFVTLTLSSRFHQNRISYFLYIGNVSIKLLLLVTSSRCMELQKMYDDVAVKFVLMMILEQILDRSSLTIKYMKLSTLFHKFFFPLPLFTWFPFFFFCPFLFNASAVILHEKFVSWLYTTACQYSRLLRRYKESKIWTIIV